MVLSRLERAVSMRIEAGAKSICIAKIIRKIMIVIPLRHYMIDYVQVVVRHNHVLIVVKDDLGLNTLKILFIKMIISNREHIQCAVCAEDPRILRKRRKKNSILIVSDGRRSKDVMVTTRVSNIKS